MQPQLNPGKTKFAICQKINRKSNLKTEGMEFVSCTVAFTWHPVQPSLPRKNDLALSKEALIAHPCFCVPWPAPAPRSTRLRDVLSRLETE